MQPRTLKSAPRKQPPRSASSSSLLGMERAAAQEEVEEVEEAAAVDVVPDVVEVEAEAEVEVEVVRWTARAGQVLPQHRRRVILGHF